MSPFFLPKAWIRLVICVSFAGGAAYPSNSACKTLLTNPPEIASILLQIDATAEELRGQKEFTSPVAWRAKTASYGLPGLDLPKAFDGMELLAEQMAPIFTHAGKYALDLRDVVGAGHARLLLYSGEPEIQAILATVSSGNGYAAIAITEPTAGSDVRAMKSLSEKTEGGYYLTGLKLFNARFSQASHVIVFTQAAGTRGKLNAFVLPIHYPGLRFVELEAYGLLGNSFGGMEFDHLFVPEKFRIGEEGTAGSLFRKHFLYWRLMMAATAVGTGQGALEQVADRIRSRHAFGAPIGRFTHLQQPLAEHTAKLHMAKLLIAQAAKRIDEKQFDEAGPLVAMAKAEGVEFALAASDFAMKTFGAEGYSKNVDLGQRVIDLMGLRIADGTTDVLRQEVVRRVYGEDLWQMAIGGIRIPAISVEAPGGARPGLSSLPDVASVLTYLQQRVAHGDNILASQQTYDPMIRPGGGGACATVTAFNLLQGLIAATGMEQYLDPSMVIQEAFSVLPELLDGRVTNDQFESLLTHLKKYLPRADYDVVFSPPPSSPNELPAPTSNEWRVLLHRVYDKGTFIGRHFVILKTAEKNLIEVLDPHQPGREYRYLVAESVGPDGKKQLELIRPNQITPPERAFFLDSIATLHLTYR